MIKKVSGGYHVVSSKGKNLGGDLTIVLSPQRNGCGRWSFSSVAGDKSGERVAEFEREEESNESSPESNSDEEEIAAKCRQAET